MSAARQPRVVQVRAGSDNCPEIVSDDCRSTAVAEGERQSERVANGVQETKGPEVSIVIRAPASGAAAAQVRRRRKAGGGRPASPLRHE
jgi:hypothetical protein